MRLTNSFLYLISWFALLLFGAVGSSHASTNVSGTISEDTTWTLDGSPYVVTSSSVTVAEGVTLTVDPGVVVKFYSYKSLDVYGALDARGTESAPVVFTAINDDSYGGDTNGDGSASIPSGGYWRGISFHTTSVNSILDHAVVKYLGYYHHSYERRGINIESSSLDIRNSLISTNSTSRGEAIRVLLANPVIQGNTIVNSRIGILLSGSNATIVDNIISGHSYRGISAYDDTSTDPWTPSLPSVYGNTITNNGMAIWLNNVAATSTIGDNIITGNTVNAIQIAGGTLTANAIWDSNDAAYYVSGAVTVPEGIMLTVGAGVVVKFHVSGYVKLNVQGTLMADGTESAPVVFTSIYDDSYGGDTNGDGNATIPWSGSWNGIHFNSTSVNSILDHVVVKYTGSIVSSNTETRGITIESSSVTISNSLISDNSKTAIRVIQADIEIRGNTIANSRIGVELFGSNATIIDNSISGHSYRGISANVNTSIESLPTITGNTIFGNATGVSNSQGASHTIKAENNYWGSPTGPYDPSDDTATGGWYNPDGLGDPVSDYVDYKPWSGSGDGACSVVSGHLYDYYTGLPIAGATVTFEGVGSVTSDANGYYEFPCMGIGRHRITVTKDGQLLYSGVDSVFGNKVIDLNIASPYASFGPGSNSGYSDDPVNTALGNYLYNYSDLKLKGRGLNIDFARGYNSQDAYNGPFGHGWNHSYNLVLSEESNGSVGVKFGDGRVGYFTPTGGGAYDPQPGSSQTLVKNGDGSFDLSDTDSMGYHFDATPRLASIADRNGNSITLGYDGSGDLTTITDTVGRTITLTYDGSHRITQLLDPIGRTIQYAYDGNGDLIAVTDARSGATSLTYDADHQILTATDPNGNVFVTNIYDSSRRVVTAQQDALGNSTTFSYDEYTHITTLTDALGNVTTHEHDDKHRLIKLTDPLRNSVSYTYDAEGNRTRITDQNGHNTDYTYDASGNVLTKSDALGHVTTITYDSHNDPLTRTDALGNTTTFTYDANGNLLTETDALGRGTTHIYNSHGQRTRTTDANSHATVFAYDAHGNLTTMTDVLGAVQTYAYDGAGRRTGKTDPLGNTKTYSYDANNNLLTVTDALGNLTSYTYDANDNQLSVIDPLGFASSSTFDVKDRLTSVTDPLGGVTAYTYDALDRKTTVTDALGNTTTFGYDAVGNLTVITNPLGQRTTSFYDAVGNRIKLLNAIGRITIYTYDAVNRLLSTSDPLGHTSSKSYDALGRLVSTTDANGNTTGYAYDAVDNLIQVTDPAGGVVIYSYDNVNNRTGMTDTLGRTTSYVYDAVNRLSSETAPLGHTTSYGYDVAGNLISHTDADSHTTSYSYDALNRLLTTTFHDGSAMTYSFDANSNRTGMADWLGATVYSYDALNRIATVIDPYGQSLGYAYDAGGNLIALTYPHGSMVTYGYDALNRVTSVSDWTGDTTTYSYDMIGNPTNTILGNDTTVTRHFDAKGRLTGIYNRRSNYSTLSGSKLTLDPVGNRTGVEHIGAQWLQDAKTEIAYSYDNEDRIGTAGVKSYAFTNSGRMLNTLDGSDITTYTHNARDRLAQMNRGSDNWQFDYNGDGNRLQKSVNGQITRYVVDPSGSLSRVLAETDETGAIIASYVYGAGLVSMVTPDDSHHYYHFDHIGATTALTGEDGTLTDTYNYSVFGVQQETTGSTGNPFGYLGKYGIQNDENGLLYVRARYYDPDTGRFITKDAYAGNEKNSQSLNRFVYGLNSPISMVDVSGFVAQQNSSDISHQFLFDYFHGFVGELLQGSFEYFGEELAKNGLSALIAHLSVGSHLSSQTLGKSSAHAMMSVGPLLSFATAWRDAYKDTYANPHRDNVEAMARFSIDATVGSILSLGTAVGISAPVSIVAGAGYSQHREEIQNSILYNPATDWAGDQIYGNLHGTRFGGWLGLNP